ncbi:hypothetical protein [Albimonas pacifica]|uniref:Uncharacterized protein n=1 Tax=Albimonas pacifica TaxID=1114924 RepID=A0A1I3QNA5_9RHOB|nr:hypothetical protein [Albimonas pacifica]SFJ35654.1 hypothetical protein SAMN05216258_1543 [Albimonas pacifica]
MSDKVAPGSAGHGRFRVTPGLQVHFNPQGGDGAWPVGVTETRLRGLLRDARGRLAMGDLARVDVTRETALPPYQGVLDLFSNGERGGYWDLRWSQAAVASGGAASSIGGKVGWLEDLGPHGNHLPQVNLAEQGILQTDGAAVWVELAEAETFFLASRFGMPASPAMTALYAWRPLNPNDSTLRRLFQLGGSGAGSIGGAFGFDWRTVHNDGAVVFNGPVPRNFGSLDTIAEWSRFAGATTGQQRFFLNGAEQTYNRHSGGTAGSTEAAFRVGGGYSGATLFGVHLRLYAALVLDRQLTSVERAAVVAHMQGAFPA